MGNVKRKYIIRAYYADPHKKEYVIDNTQKAWTHANIDDSTTYWTLNLRDAGQGYIKR